MYLHQKHIENVETSYVHQLDVEVFYLNEYGIMKPSAYQALFAQLAERHLDIFHCGANETMKYGFAWALISMSIEVKQPLNTCIQLSAYTWYSQRIGPYFRRELVFCNEYGDIMFQGSTFSVLLEISNRRVFRKKELPVKLPDPNAIFCMEAGHRFRESPDYKLHETRRVHSSDVDLLGHVNNRRYGDFAYDALSREEILRLKEIKRMDFYFTSEMRDQDQFALLKYVDRDRILVRGNNNIKEDTSFDIIFQF